MIKIGFIGTGGISGAHMKCLQHRKDVKIAALCDINREQALKRQKGFPSGYCQQVSGRMSFFRFPSASVKSKRQA